MPRETLIEGSRCLVTGGARGIGLALARALKDRGATAIVLSDRDVSALEEAAAEIGATPIVADLASAEGPAALIRDAEAAMGGIDILCSNAGLLVADPDPDQAASASDADWQMSWDLNVMAHVRLARAALPGMEAEGSGHVLLTVSAAGLLTMIGHAPYAVTKAAALAFAQNLAITHGDRGIGVSALCPQAVTTDMLQATPRPEAAMAAAALSAEETAEAALDGIAAGRFLILPHPEVADYARKRADDLDRWIGGMRKLRRGLG